MTEISELQSPSAARPRWADRVTFAATAWSLGYGLVALMWTVTGRGFPLGENDPDGVMSMLGDLPAQVGAPMMMTVALAGVVVGSIMVRSGAATVPLRRIVLVFGTVTALGWLVIVQDTRILALVGYLPMLIVLAPFDEDLRSSLWEALDGVYLHHVAALGGGFLWAAATLAFARRTAGACERCGRGSRGGWNAAALAQRWGRTAVVVAVLVPALYAVTRWIWVLGLPLGIDKESHAEGMATGDLWAGAWLGTFALAGGILTLGLVQRWGEIFPWWIPGLRGRRVPIKLAVVPAAFIAVIVTSGGLSLIKVGLSEGVIRLAWDQWAAIGPALLWPAWGVALAIATYAYYVRRQGRCRLCGRDDVIATDERREPEPAGRVSR